MFRKCLSLLVVFGFVGANSFAKTPTVRVDGSSTVYPISAAIAEEFQNDTKNKGIRVTVAYSGTGGGFKKWCVGETDINNASRPIKKKEIACAKKHGIEYLEVPVAYDGLSVVVSQKNKFAKNLTMKQLNALWKPGSKVKMWSDLNPAWPQKAIKLYGPGTDSGTFDYFTEVVNGDGGLSRSDYIKSEDDNVLVKGVSASEYALGYFGYAYYEENKNKLRAVSIAKDKGPVAPSLESIKSAVYPLSRPIFIYVSDAAVKRSGVVKFVNYYLENAKSIASQVGYTPLPEATYETQTKKVAAFVGKSTKKKKAE